MKIKRNINNNVSLCLDSKNNEVVVFGKGIGFIKQGEEIPLERIERTFYNLNNHYISMLNDISNEAINISDIVLNFAVEMGVCEFNGSLLFGLADHIDYAIERYKKGIALNLAIANDINHLYEAELKVGKYALKVIEGKTGVQLPKEEATYIALNIINSEYNTMKSRAKINDEVIDEITNIIENAMNIKIERDNFSYSRFVSHMHYLMKRADTKYTDNNSILFNTMVSSSPEIYNCAKKIDKYLNGKFGWNLSDDECLYLMLHINRLCDDRK